MSYQVIFMDTYDRIVSFINRLDSDIKFGIVVDNHKEGMSGFYAKLVFDDQESATALNDLFGWEVLEELFEDDEFSAVLGEGELNGMFERWQFSGHGETEEEALEDLFDILLVPQASQYEVSDF